MSAIRPAPLPAHYSEIDANMKIYRLSDDVPKREDPLAAARGLVNGIMLGLFAWCVIGVLVYAWWVTR